MASLYKRKKSPFWWVKWNNPLTKKNERISTKCPTTDPRRYIQAVQMRNNFSEKEIEGRSPSHSHPFSEWVTDYLRHTHSTAPGTLTRYLGAWKVFSAYLHSLAITTPAQVTRAHCLGFVPWRKNLAHLNSRRKAAGKPISMNTVLLDLKVLSKILQEAVTREFILFNPCSRLKLRRDPARIKDEISDAQYEIVRDFIARQRQPAITDEQKAVCEFLENSFEIARLQGIRLSETYFPLTYVNFPRQTILVRGKGNRLEEVNLNPNLSPLLRQLAAAGKTHTYIKPRHASIHWFKLFKKIRHVHPEFKNISYHSTRVTVITRMERAGVPENVMMKTVLHASTTVHRGYRRVRAEELAPFWKSLNLASGATSPAPNHPVRENSDSPPANRKKTSP